MAWPASIRTWLAGETLTAALLNEQVRDALKALGDPWTSYTPTLSNWTKVNGTLNGYYLQTGKRVEGVIEYTVGSTDTKSGGPVFSLPVAAKSTRNGMSLGVAFLNDISVPTRAYRNVIQSSTTSVFLADDADTRLSPTAPWTWATGDVIIAPFIYEAA